MLLSKVSQLIVLASLALVMAHPVSAIAAPPSTKAKPPAAKPAAEKAPEKPAAKPAPEPVLENVVSTTADDLVSKPQEFMGKNVKFNANFFAFSSLALDYKPALRSSKTHLSFLILRPDSHIPLSELKLAMMIPKEKDPESTLLANLKDGDQLEILGKVFSTALDDPWVEVFKVKKIGGSTDDKDKKASAEKTKVESTSEKTPDKTPEKTPEEKPGSTTP